jgi:hypothetical protein
VTKHSDGDTPDILTGGSAEEPAKNATEDARHNFYLVRQYMSHLSDAEFEQRGADIFVNVHMQTPNNCLVNAPPRGWIDLWGDVRDEAYRRFSPEEIKQSSQRLRAGLSKFKTVYYDKDSLAALYERAASSNGFIVKYGERKYLEPAYRSGQITIFPASKYNDPSLNCAIKDDELNLAMQPNPQEIKLEVFDKTGRPKGTVKPINNLITSSSQTNYYVLCMSNWLSLALFAAFGTDCCLLITKPETFIRRLLEGLNSQLPSPAWGYDGVDVKYVDPLNIRVTQFSVPKAKHFRFAYQQEFRVIWGPNEPIADFTWRPVELRLGSLEDCCTLFCTEGTVS